MADVDQSEIVFANLKQQVDNMINSCDQANKNMINTCDQANKITLQHLQNSVNAANQMTTNFNANWNRVYADDARIAREMEVGEATANRLLGEIIKLPTADYLLAISMLAELLLKQESKQQEAKS